MDWGAVSILFDELVDKDPQARAAHLESANLNDETRTVVSRMLSQADRETRFMNVTREVDNSPSLTRGEKVGVWRVETLLGRGGMGEVYKVSRDDGQFEQVAALKLLHALSSSQQDRFTRERQILARLEHPNLSRLIDGGVSHKGQPYLVMEYVTGEHVTRYAASRNLSLGERLALVLPIASALGHAHGRLVLHRDVKPSNVLVTEMGQVKVIDFSVASILSADDADLAAPLSRAYAAPEQWQGEPVSVATDVYGLGSLMHEVLTGETVNRRDVTSGLKGLPVDVAAILSKSLSEDPLHRYRSVEAFADDIDNYISARPVAARGGGKAYRLARFFKRYRVASLATAGLILALTSGIFGTTLMAKKAEQEANRANRVKDAIIDIFRRADPIAQDARLSNEANAWDYLALASEDAQETLKDDPQTLQEILTWSSVMERRAGQYDKSLTTLKEAYNLQYELKGPDDLTTIYLELRVIDLSADFRTSAEIEEADLFFRVADIQRRIDKTDTDNPFYLVQSYNVIGDILKRAGKYQEARTSYERSLKIMAAKIGAFDNERIEAYYNLSETLKFLSEFELSVEAAEKSLSLTEKYFSKDHFRVVAPLSRLANIYDENNEPEKAIPLLERAIKIEAQYYEGLEGSLGLLQNNLANNYTTLGKLDEAEKIYLSQIRIFQETGRDKSDDMAALYQNVAQLYEKQENYSLAVDYLNRSKRIRDAILGETDFMRYISSISLSRVNIKAGDVQAALESSIYAQDKLKAILPSDHFVFGLLQCFEGQALAMQGRTSSARGKLLSGAAMLKDYPARIEEYTACNAALKNLN